MTASEKSEEDRDSSLHGAAGTFMQQLDSIGKRLKSCFTQHEDR